MKEVLYALVVDSLMYTILCTRPDIYHVVSLISKYQLNPSPDHWTIVKCILKYLIRTRDYMLIYGSDELILAEYTDYDFMSNNDSKRSVKQDCTADFTSEVEYCSGY